MPAGTCTIKPIPFILTLKLSRRVTESLIMNLCVTSDKPMTLNNPTQNIHGILQHCSKLDSLVTSGHGRGELGLKFPQHIPPWDISRLLSVSFPRNPKHYSQLSWSTQDIVNDKCYGLLCRPSSGVCKGLWPFPKFWS